jgi:hypothetical protein
MASTVNLLNIGRNAPAHVPPGALIPPIIIAGFPEPMLTLKPIVTTLPIRSEESTANGAAAHRNRCNQRSKIEIQTMQIDGAIQLLKIQYEAIMSNVRKSQVALMCCNTPVTTQTSFLSQFDLPGADRNGASTMAIASMCGAAMPSHRKRAAENTLNDEIVKKQACLTGNLVLDAEVKT